MTPNLGLRDAAASTAPLVLEYAGIPVLLETLHADKYRVLGPTLRDESVRIGEIRTIEDLPRGIASSQEAGSFRLLPRPDRALFGFPVGADSWKRFLLPPRAKAAGFRRAGRGFEPEPDLTGAPGTEEEALPREAWIGVRPCDLAAIRILDRVFLFGGSFLLALLVRGLLPGLVLIFVFVRSRHALFLPLELLSLDHPLRVVLRLELALHHVAQRLFKELCQLQAGLPRGSLDFDPDLPVGADGDFEFFALCHDASSLSPASA